MSKRYWKFIDTNLSKLTHLSESGWHWTDYAFDDLCRLEDFFTSQHINMEAIANL